MIFILLTQSIDILCTTIYNELLSKENEKNEVILLTNDFPQVETNLMFYKYNNEIGKNISEITKNNNDNVAIILIFDELISEEMKQFCTNNKTNYSIIFLKQNTIYNYKKHIDESFSLIGFKKLLTMFDYVIPTDPLTEYYLEKQLQDKKVLPCYNYLKTTNIKTDICSYVGIDNIKNTKYINVDNWGISKMIHSTENNIIIYKQSYACIYENPYDVNDDELVENNCLPINSTYASVYEIYENIMTYEKIYKKFLQTSNLTEHFKYITSPHPTSGNIEYIRIDFKNVNTPIHVTDKRVGIIFHQHTHISPREFNKLVGIYYEKNYFTTNKTVIFRSYGSDQDEPIIITTDDGKTLSELISQGVPILDKIYGQNKFQLGVSEIINLFKIYGNTTLIKMFYPLINLPRVYIDYIKNFLNDSLEQPAQKINVTKFIQLLSLYCTCNNIQLDENNLRVFLQKNKKSFNRPKCLIISKNIIGNGGNQKTMLQIYELLSSVYDVDIWHLINTKINDTVHNTDILKISSFDDLIYFINDSYYEFILLNQTDEMLERLRYIKTTIPKILLSHNCMATFNKGILENIPYIKKILTVNKSLICKLIDAGVKKPISQYINNITSQVNDPPLRTKMTNNICFIGRLSHEKNIMLLLKAWNIFVKNNPYNKLIIIGGGRYKIKNDIPNVIFTGEIDRNNIEHIVKLCDYIILPSYTEGMPHAIIEGMNMGIPCICSDIYGVNELVINNINGFLFKLNGYDNKKDILYDLPNFENVRKSVDICFEKNVESLTNALTTAYSITIDKWIHMSKNALQTIKDEFNKEITKNINLRKIISDKTTIILINNDNNDNLVSEVVEKLLLIFGEFCDVSGMKNLQNYEQFIDKYDYILLINNAKNINIFTDDILSYLIKIRMELHNYSNFSDSDGNRFIDSSAYKTNKNIYKINGNMFKL